MYLDTQGWPGKNGLLVYQYLIHSEMRRDLSVMYLVLLSVCVLVLAISRGRNEEECVLVRGKCGRGRDGGLLNTLETFYSSPPPVAASQSDPEQH